MTRNQIIKAAETNDAVGFLALAEQKGLAPTILDQDNIMNANDGYLNVIVNGLARGEALLFVDGKFSGL
jgi:hypothetical protein